MRGGECAVVRQGHLVAVVAFLIGCFVLLLMVGCSGTRSETSNEKEQGSSPQATASEEAQCEGTRTILRRVFPQGPREDFLTNDLPGCPNKGGLLKGTDKQDFLDGKDGEDEIRGLGGKDEIYGDNGNDVIHAGPGDDAVDTSGDDDGDDVIYGSDGDDEWIGGGNGEDVIYGGDGIDFIISSLDDQPDKLYCGEGKDYYNADKNDQVSSSCEEKYTPNA
jgi:Ca2+-binding RTX toxin-like protein